MGSDSEKRDLGGIQAVSYRSSWAPRPGGLIPAYLSVIQKVGELGSEVVGKKHFHVLPALLCLSSPSTSGAAGNERTLGGRGHQNGEGIRDDSCRTASAP